MPATEAPRKVGRPPATSRKQILEVARRLFAERGWEVTTNKHVADAAGVTSAALYHYFDSKLDMYLAVYDDVQELMAERLLAPIEDQPTFAAQFAAVLELAHDLNGDDPSIARFLGSARVDAARYPEIRDGLRKKRSAGDEMIAKMVATGIASGEIDPARKGEVTAFVRSTLTGLTDAVSDNQRVHRLAVDAFLLLIQGELFTPAALDGRRRRSGRLVARAR